MAERVVVYKTMDGEMFENAHEADKHEQEIRIHKEIMAILCQNASHRDFDDMEDLAKFLTAFVMNEREERDHWWSVTNNDD